MQEIIISFINIGYFTESAQSFISFGFNVIDENSDINNEKQYQQFIYLNVVDIWFFESRNL